MKPKRSLYQWLTTNFLVHIRDEENFSLKRSFNFNYAKLLVYGVATLTIITIFNFYIFKVVDDYSSDEARRERAYNDRLIKLAVSIDSLENEIALKDSFILDIKRVMNGQEIKKNYNDSAEPTSSVEPATDNADRFSGTLSEAEKQLRDEFESTQLASTSNNLSLEGGLSDIFFFTPAAGLISNSFDPKKSHLGIDIVSKENEPVKAVANGSVVYAGWSYDTGYMLVLQHHKELISVYKHNATLMKKVGEPVKAGEVVAIMGNSGELTSGPHLHFELWYNGIALNPTDYIVF